jgi:hypothetical protein
MMPVSSSARDVSKAGQGRVTAGRVYQRSSAPASPVPISKMSQSVAETADDLGWTTVDFGLVRLLYGMVTRFASTDHVRKSVHEVNCTKSLKACAKRNSEKGWFKRICQW